jgi:SAM-dependent methyltransferase
MTGSGKGGPQFDRIARLYWLLEALTFGPALQRARTRLLGRVAHCRRALLFGDGDGRFTARLLAAAPHLQAEAVDLSPGMLGLLRRRAEKASATAAGRLATHVADALEYRPVAAADLVVTHFFLDCLSEVEVRRFVEGLREHIEPGGLWLVSEFRIPPAGALRAPAWVLVRGLYVGFRVLTGLRTTRLPEYAAVLRGAGFVRVEQRLGLGGMLTSELWRLAAGEHLSYGGERDDFSGTHEPTQRSGA